MLRSHFRSFAVVLLLLLGLGLLGTSCQNRAGDCMETLTCEATGGTEATGGSEPGSGGSAEGGQGGLGGAQGGMGGMGGTTIEPCDPTKEECSGGFIVHVSPLGDDDGDGSAADPVQTISTALARVATAVEEDGEDQPLIYLCATAGSYTETLTLGPQYGTLGIFGGFECENFEAAEERALVVAEAASGHRIEAASGVTLGDLELESPDATGNEGASSIVLTVVESTGVQILRSELVAGEGAPGAEGEGYTVAERAPQGAEGNEGTDACVVTSGVNEGGAAVTSSCGSGPSASVGGNGGPGGVSSFPGGDGAPGQPDGGTAGTGEDGGICMPGGPGEPGGNGEPGVPSSALGSIDEDGYAPPVGGAGTSGEIGEGGGGGGGAAKPGSCTTGASGGSGGGGGCPGAGAAGGQGGGGSFGLVSVSSQVELLDVAVVLAGGGQGGVGGDGQPGGLFGTGAVGGTPGDAGDGTQACRGGDGGQGGRGGAGAGGAGGPAIGVAYVGPAPSGDPEVELPSAAPGGDGGALNTPEGDGLPGVVQASMSF